LNPVERAKAFDRLVKEFKFKHIQIAEKVGKSREYVSNSLRLLMLPSDMLDALSSGKIVEGHARPLMMLTDRPEEQATLFKEILIRKMTVREAEIIARKIAIDRARKKDYTTDPELMELEEKMTESLGTRVQIERKSVGGKVVIDFFSTDDLRHILDIIKTNSPRDSKELLKRHMALQTKSETPHSYSQEKLGVTEEVPANPIAEAVVELRKELTEIGAEEKPEEDEDSYSMKNFSI
jgi:hypothetical protein